VQVSALLVLLPAISLAHNWHQNDRSKNLLPYYYAKNLLDSCEPNAILFTGGDNDTFPVWCLQEVYNYRKDIRCVNLSLLNTDWYVEQMKERYNVPISLTREQIRWTEPDARSGLSRPARPFFDEPRNRTTFLVNSYWNGQPVRVADMMTEEIVLRNGFKDPIYFSAPPSAESPLRLAEHAVHVAQVFRLELHPNERLIDVDKGFELFTQVYDYDGYHNSEVFRDDNATGVGMGVVMTSARLYDELLFMGDTTRALALYRTFIDRYPEYWQAYMATSEIRLNRGDTAGAVALWQQLHDTLSAFVASNPNNPYYLQDLGGIKFDLGRWNGDAAMMEAGLALVRRGFYIDPNNNYGFRKLIALLSQAGKIVELQQVARDHARYKRNLSDPYVQRILGLQSPMSSPLQRAPGQ
jgi:tetratricopeptide (TPR) repeat protein